MINSRYLVGDVAVYKRKTVPHWDAEYGIQHLVLHLADDRRFTRAQAEVVAGVVMGGDLRQYELLAWCVMPNHLHTVVCPSHPLAKIVQAWKGISSRRLGGGNWWSRNFFDRLVRCTEDLSNTVDYVMTNPEAAGLENWDVRRIYAERLAPRL